MHNKILAERVGYFKDKEKGGKSEMCEIMDRLITNAEKETKLEAIKNIIVELNVSPKRAMEIIHISEQEQATYLGLLGLKA